MAFNALAAPKSLLGVHRQLAPSAGVKVSPLCIGGMSFGTAWGEWLGACDQKTTFEILDYFYENGGNFIDTANNYQQEESETLIGEWMKQRGNRDEMVLATKYTTGYRAYEGRKIIQSNFGGMNTKSLRHSLDASLAKLQTTYLDVLYIHWWDYSADIPEVMQALDAAVKQGKILYLGVSDTPAWIVAKANQYARDHGLRQFVVYQGKWSAATRDLESDIIPMCRSEGMGIAPWGALGGGLFKTNEQREKQEGRKSMWPTDDKVLKTCEVLEKIAKRKGTIMTSVAQAYVMHKYPYVYPIIGCRKLEYLKANIEALGIELTREEMTEIEEANPFDLGFPHNFAIRGKSARDVSGSINFSDVFLNENYGTFGEVDYPQPIKVSDLKAKLAKE